MCLLPKWGWCQWWVPELCGNWRWVRWAGSPPGPFSSAGKSRAPGCPGWSSIHCGRQRSDKTHGQHCPVHRVEYAAVCCHFLVSFVPSNGGGARCAWGTWRDRKNDDRTFKMTRNKNENRKSLHTTETENILSAHFQETSNQKQILQDFKVSEWLYIDEKCREQQVHRRKPLRFLCLGPKTQTTLRVFICHVWVKCRTLLLSDFLLMCRFVRWPWTQPWVHEHIRRLNERNSDYLQQEHFVK